MGRSDFPPELEAIERELVAELRAVPPAGLRGRVMAGVHRELGRERLWSRWIFAAQVAAAAAIWINLSWSAARATERDLMDRRPPRSLVAGAEEIRLLLPGIPEREALRQAILLEAGSSLARCPALQVRPPDPRQLRNLREISGRKED